MIFDTHAHLNVSDFDEDREDLVGKCLEDGIGMINVGTNYASSAKAVEIAERHDSVYASIGLHPLNIDSEFFKIKSDSDAPENGLEKGFDFEKYRELAKSEKVVAIGECGLDYWHKPKGAAKKDAFKVEQKNIFLREIDLGSELKLPLIIHCRNAFDEMINILQEKKVKGVIHCFTGTVEQMHSSLSLGFYIGINGIIFKTDLEDVLREVPLEKVLIETDCPYLSPPGFDERNNPLAVRVVIKELARIKGVSEDEIGRITAKNAVDLFGL